MPNPSEANKGNSSVHPNNNTDHGDGRRQFIEQSVLTAYYKSSGIATADLDKNLSTSAFADSLARIRAREYLRKQFGLVLTIRDMTKHKTIASQIHFLQMQGPRPYKATSAPTKIDLPVAVVDMYDCFGGHEQGVNMQQVISKTLRARGLPGSDCVSSIFPVHDYLQMLLQTELIDSWNFGIAVMSRASSVKVKPVR